MLVPPDVEAPVEPLVPELLLVPLVDPLGDDDDEDEGAFTEELPEAPMPEDVPDVLLGVEAEALPEGVDSEPEAVPPVDPMPDAVPDVEPDAVVPQAARAAAVMTRGATIFNMLVLLLIRGEAS